MRWVLLGLCACNSVFGIRDTDLIDAPPPPPPPADAPPDAPPPTCPATGTLPAFGTDLKQVSARYCGYFEVDEAQTSAIAMCVRSDYTTYFSTGTIETGVTEKSMSPSPGGIAAVHMAPSGNRMFVVAPDASMLNVVYEYELIGTTWTQTSSAPFSPAGSSDQPGWFEISSPSRGPTPRMMARVIDGSYVENLIELQWTGSAWNEISRVASGDFLIDFESANIYEISLSPDGLRMVFTAFDNRVVTGNSGGPVGTGGPLPPSNGGSRNPVMYADRASLAVPFTNPRILDSVPGAVSTPVLTQDCGRILFSALDTVWYLEQPKP